MAALPACAVGFQNALGALAPPEVAVHLDWAGGVRVNGAHCGRLRAAADTRDPLAVPGWLVVGLDRTGSDEVPAFLRQWLINEMKKRGLGSAKLGTEQMTPERVLADERTAVVEIAGFIPPGAVEGTRFDVVVTSVDTQTTSLAGGTLWSADLAAGGATAPNRFLFKQAEAAGATFVNPFDQSSPDEEKLEYARSALIAGGGKVTEKRRLGPSRTWSSA